MIDGAPHHESATEPPQPAGGDEAFDRFARLAARLLRAPAGMVTVIDGSRQIFRGCAGDGPHAAARVTPLSHSFCRYVV
ncbi:MAG TPA: hypothetical protein VGB92_07155, partial [Longimicrobium sp.]